MIDKFKEEVKAKLQQDAEKVCEHLLPNGTKKGDIYTCGDAQGNSGSSMKVTLSKGLWYDHAMGIGGDMLSLWMENKGLKFPEALHQAGRFVGISNAKLIKPKPHPKGYNRDIMGAIRGTPIIEHLHNRGIKEQTLKDYRIRSHPIPPLTKNRNGTPWHNKHWIAYQYETPDGKPSFLKATGIERDKDGKKEVFSTSPTYTLWGWWNVKPHHKEVIITEGEEDAMSFYQMLGQDIPCLSLPNGSNSDKFLDYDFEYLQQFDKFYLCLDSDEAGEIGAQSLAKRLGQSKCFRVKLPEGYKDANKVLTDAPESLKTPDKWLEDATTYDPETIRQGASLVNSTLRMREARRSFQGEGSWAYDAPFEPLPGECSLLHGYVSHGKSDNSYQMALNDLAVGKRVLYVSFEIPAEEILENMCQQWVGRFPRDRDIQEFYDWTDGRLIAIDNESDNLNWTILKEDIGYCVQRFKVNMCYIDSFGFLVSKKDYEGQDKLAVEIKKLAAKWRPLHIFMLAHSVYKEGGEYVMPAFDGMEGSKGIPRPFQNVFAHHRNVKKEEVLSRGIEHPDYNAKDWEDEPDARLKCWKQRNGHRKRFEVDLWFDFEGRSFRQNKADKPSAIRAYKAKDTAGEQPSVIEEKGTPAPRNDAFENYDERPFG